MVDPGCFAARAANPALLDSCAGIELGVSDALVVLALTISSLLGADSRCPPAELLPRDIVA